MILRSLVVRHGRQAVAARPGLRTLSTDRRHVFGMPTGYAEPPPSETQPQDRFSEFKPVAETKKQPAAKTVALADPQAPQLPSSGGPSPMKLWKMKNKVRVDNSIATRYLAKARLEKMAKKIGSVPHKRFDPRILLQHPPTPEEVTLELLMSSQTHMGHHTSLWNPANQRFIYGVRSGIHIISLEETAAALRRAARIVEEVAFRGGLTLFVGTRKGQMEAIARAAELAGACHLFTKWVPGTLTNRDILLGKEPMTVVDEHDKPRAGFERHLLDRRPLVPDLVVVLNPLENYQLLHECSQENIPTIGLIDTDADATKVTYMIPGNDDSLRSVGLIAGVLGRAGEKGQKRRINAASQGIVTWKNKPEIDRWQQEITSPEDSGDLVTEDSSSALRGFGEEKDLGEEENEKEGDVERTLLGGLQEGAAGFEGEGLSKASNDTPRFGF